MTTTTSKRAQFLATLRENVDAWHEGEIDHATFTAVQRDTWDAIHLAGPSIESEVLRALRDQLPLPGSHSDAKSARQGLRYRR